STTFRTWGVCIGLEYPNSFISAGATSFAYFSLRRGKYASAFCPVLPSVRPPAPSPLAPSVPRAAAGAAGAAPALGVFAPRSRCPALLLSCSFFATLALLTVYGLVSRRLQPSWTAPGRRVKLKTQNSKLKTDL